MNKTKDIAIIGVMTALYVVFSLTLKIPMGVGAIALDLGYIVLTIACMRYGWLGLFVGGIGAFLESLLFSAYGISYGWIAMNVVIGVLCGLFFTRFNKGKLNLKAYLICVAVIVVSVFIGAAIKTVIECYLYSIPLLVKIPKSLVAWGIDSVVMIIGLPIASKLNERRFR